jgi:hypothetical protein
MIVMQTITSTRVKARTLDCFRAEKVIWLRIVSRAAGLDFASSRLHQQRAGPKPFLSLRAICQENRCLHPAH